MNWINRYVQAVVLRLPKEEQQDVYEELTSLLEEEAESYFEENLSSIDPSKLKSWIQTKDHPAIAANSYHPKRSLIDESTFPLFRSAIKAMLLILGVVAILKLTFELILTDGSRFIGSLIGSSYGYLHSALIGFAILTLVFHVASKQLKAKDWYRRWYADALPPLNQKWVTIPYSSSISTAVWAAIVMSWLLGWLNFPIFSLRDPGTIISPTYLSKEIGPILPWIIGLHIAVILLSVINMLHPYWRTWNLLLSASISLIAAILLFQISSISPVFEWSTFLDINDEKMQRLLSHMDSTLMVCLRIAAVVNLYGAGKSLFRTAKLNYLKTGFKTESA